MTKITIPCSDGTDPDCYGDLEFEMADELDPDQLQEIIDEEGQTYIHLSKTQVDSMGLSPRDIEPCSDHPACYLWQVDLGTVCAACGSDQ